MLGWVKNQTEPSRTEQPDPNQTKLYYQIVWFKIFPIRTNRTETNRKRTEINRTNKPMCVFLIIWIKHTTNIQYTKIVRLKLLLILLMMLFFKKKIFTLVNFGFIVCFIKYLWFLRFLFQFYIRFSLHSWFLRGIINDVFFFNFLFTLVNIHLIVFL